MWIIMEWQHISLEVVVKGVKKCCVSSAVIETDEVSCGLAVKRAGC
jgi:hypothetical protein